MRTRSWRRRLLFTGALALGLWLVVEGLAFIAYFALHGERFSFARVHAAQAARARVAGEQPATPATAFQDSGGDTCIHPYLGFVANRDTDDQMLLPARGVRVTSHGFVDAAEPVRRRAPDRVLIGIFGGSVAEFFGQEGTDELAARLRAHAAFASKRIEFVRLGLGGFKQPQQLLALTYVQALGGEFDLAVNLDGFNEATLGPLENVPRGVPAFYPRNWSLLAEHAPDPAQRRLIGTVAVLQDAQRRLAAAFNAGFWRWSVAAGLLWKGIDSYLDRAAGGQLLALQQNKRDDLPFHITGPGADASVGDDALADESVANWTRCSQAMARQCQAHGIAYFHFLQPNQYFSGSKNLTADEQRLAFDANSRYRPWVERTYPKMRAAGAQLARSGVRFSDLTQLFADESGTVYIDDCCHFNAAGNQRLAQAIAAAILRETSGGAAKPPAKLTALRAEPAAPKFDRPFTRLELRAFGRRADGSESDVTYANTTYASSDPMVVVVDGYGTLTARAHGDARVTVTCGDARVEVPVSVRFAPVIDLGGGFAPRPLHRPVLHASERDGKITLRVTPPGDALPGAISFAVDPAPRAFCGGLLVVPMQGAAVQALGGTGAEVQIDMVFPDPARQTVYVQAVYRATGDTCGFAVSNALAITR